MFFFRDPARALGNVQAHDQEHHPESADVRHQPGRGHAPGEVAGGVRGRDLRPDDSAEHHHHEHRQLRHPLPQQQGSQGLLPRLSPVHDGRGLFSTVGGVYNGMLFNDERL